MRKKSMAALAVVAALAGGTLAALPEPAEASSVIVVKKPGVRFYKVRPGFHFGLSIGPHFIYRSFTRCGSLRHRALITGSKYWYRRWEACRFGYH